MEHLHALRSSHEYYQGDLIDEAAEAAFAVDAEIASQTQRKRVSRQLRSVIHQNVAMSLEAEPAVVAVPDRPAVFAALDSAFQSLVKAEG